MSYEPSHWMDTLAGYLEPAKGVVINAQTQVMAVIESHDFPPAVMNACKKSTAIVEEANPVYLAAGALAATGMLFLACGCCTAPKSSKPTGRSISSSKKRSKSKTKTANEVASKDPSSRDGGAGGGVEKAGQRGLGGARTLPKKSPGTAVETPAASALKAKTAKKNAAKPASHVKGKGAATQPPPVITEEPETAKKKTRGKKKPAKEAAAKSVEALKKASTKASGGRPTANGSTEKGAVGSGQLRAANGGGDSGVEAALAAQLAYGGGEWQTPAPEGEWETVSHKKSRPRKEKTAVEKEQNTIPGGLGL